MKIELPAGGEKIYLKDYQVPAYQVLQAEFTVELLPGCAEVHATLKLQRHPQAPADAPLVLLGASLELLALAWDGQPLTADDWHWAGEQWVFPGATDAGVFTSTVRIYPDSNLALEGLYRSHGLYCTQCEAEGFRKITLYPDRPDVLSLSYPVQQFAVKAKSFSPDKEPAVGVLTGNKGQYLLFDTGVLNVRKYTGHEWEVTVL